MMEYKSLSSRPNPTPVGPTVNFDRNRFYLQGSTWVDNRSGLEQAIELFSYADCGFIGCSRGSFSTSCAAATALNGTFGTPDDGTVSEWLVSAMSSQSPATVSSLISFIDWLNGFSLPLVCNGAGCALEALGCSSARADDAEIAGFVRAVGQVARAAGLVEPGYRLLANIGGDAHQEVPHLHVHIFGGRQFREMIPAPRG